MRLLGVLALALVLGGCGFLDTISGADREDGEKPIITKIVETAANSAIPGLGTLIAGGLAAYAEARRRKWKAAAVAQATATFKARESAGDDGKIDESKLIEAQVAEQDKAGVRTLIKGVVSKIEAAQP